MYNEADEQSQNMVSLKFRNARYRKAEMKRWQKKKSPNVYVESISFMSKVVYEKYKNATLPTKNENMLMVIKSRQVRGGFVDYLFSSSNLYQYALESILTPTQNLYERLFVMFDDERSKFDQFCQEVIAYLYVMLEDCNSCGCKNRKSSFWCLVVDFIGSETFTEMKMLLHRNLRVGQFVIIIIYCLADVLSEIVREMLDDLVVRDSEEDKNPSVQESVDVSINLNDCIEVEILEDCDKREVCGFVGSALASLKIRYRKREFYLTSRCQDACVAKSLLNFLSEMTVRHCDVVGNDDYMTNCYSSYDQMNNNGGLTLISPAYYPFGKMLMKEVRNVTTRKSFLLHGNDFAKKAHKLLLENDSLKECFLECKNEEIICEEKKIQVFNDLLPMVLNRKVGERIKVFNNEN
jgi:hypothetical protein